MKKTKRILCLVLSLVFMLTLTASIYAQAAEKVTYVAKISIFAWTKNSTDPGHGWIYIENLSDKTLTVGAYKLKSGKAVSVGVFMNSTRKEGRGVYYNLESYLVNKFGASPRYSISQKLTSKQLSTVSKTICKNNGWSVVKNCAYFAATVWNSVADKKLHSLASPAVLKSAIRKNGAAKDKKLMNVSAKNVYKHKVGSNGPYLKVVGAATLEKSL